MRRSKIKQTDILEKINKKIYFKGRKALTDFERLKRKK